MTRLQRLFAPLTGWFATRPLREQGLLLAGSVLLVVYLAVTCVWQPLLAARTVVVGQIQQDEHALTALASLPSARPKIADPRPIARILTETAPDFGLSIRRIDATEAGADLTLDDATFDGVILWLDMLDGQQGLTIANLQITRRPQAGLVAATMTLKAAP